MARFHIISLVLCAMLIIVTADDIPSKYQLNVDDETIVLLPTVGLSTSITQYFRAGFVCHQPPETGVCLASFTRYHFDDATKSCKPFVYGGCRGNSNNFKSIEACEELCSEFMK